MIDGVITEGDPADVILDCAKDQNADLIVMGARGLIPKCSYNDSFDRRAFAHW